MYVNVANGSYRHKTVIANSEGEFRIFTASEKVQQCYGVAEDAI